MKPALSTLLATAVASALSLIGFACEHGASSTPTPVNEVDAADSGTPSDAATEASPREDGGIDGAAQLGPRDRAGRPFIARWLVAESNRDAYNEEPNPFQISPKAKAAGATTAVGPDMTARLAALDALDGKTDGVDAGIPNLTTLLLTDALIVDTAKPYSATSYLDVELGGGAHVSCGGRTPAEDVYDKTLSYFVARKTSGESDGVDAPSAPPSLTFPYLAAPQ